MIHVLDNTLKIDRTQSGHHTTAAYYYIWRELLVRWNDTDMTNLNVEIIG